MSLAAGPDAEAASLHPIDLSGVDAEQVASWYRSMALIREFETTAEPLVMQGRIPAGRHSAAGQEAPAVRMGGTLAATDIVPGTHRSHHITLAKGLAPDLIMAELFGKATGPLGGRGGRMHLADLSKGHFGSNGIVGAGLGIALGAALAASVTKTGQVAAGFIGARAANIGRGWE